MDKERFYKCVCGGEVLVIDSTYTMEDGCVDFSMFRRFPRDTSIKERLRCCWWILKTGYPFTDAMILHTSQLQDVGEHLIELSRLDEQNKKE